MTLRMDFVGLLGARGAKLLIGLAVLFVYARIFGVSRTYDAWIWALGIVNAVNLFLFGPVAETIRASYAAIEHKDGQSQADQYLATVAVILIASASVVAVLIVWATYLFDSRAASFSAMDKTEAAAFLYALAPSLVLSQIVIVLTAHMNCRNIIYRPEIAGIVGGAFGILFVVAFPNLPAIWLLITSYYLTLMAPLLAGATSGLELARGLMRLDLAAFRRHGRGALIFALPLFLPYGVGQLAGLIERQIALLAGVGVLSVLSYAFFARNTVQAVFTAALSTLAVPKLARAWLTNEEGSFYHAVTHWSQQCLLLVTMGMITLYGLSDVIPELLFGNKIGLEPQLLLGLLLRCYALAIIAVTLYLVGGSALLSAHKGKTYALLGSLASCASALLMLSLFSIVGVAAIPIALGISHFAAAWLMLRVVARPASTTIVMHVAIRAGVVLAAGSALHHTMMSTATFAPLFRLAIGAGASALLCGLWWIAEHGLAIHIRPKAQS